MIWAVVLAAGESKRMGRPKLLLPYGEKAIIEVVVRNVLASKVDRTLVVLGSRWRTLKDILRGLPVATTVNCRYKKGMLSSVQRGMAVLPRSARAAVVVLADQPNIGPEVIDSLLEAYHRKGKGIIIPVYRRQRGHPLLVDLKYRKEIQEISPQIGLRQLLQKHAHDIGEVNVPRLEILEDIDSPADFQNLKKRKDKNGLGGR